MKRGRHQPDYLPEAIPAERELGWENNTGKTAGK
jgi:hypothetical protein